MTRWERSHKSWNVTPVSNDAEETKSKRTAWEKLRLLLWKNYKIQTRHKWQTVIEVLLPLLFTIILVVIRIVIKSDKYPEPTYYPAFRIQDDPPYETFFKCDRLFYAPKNKFTDNLMQTIYEEYFLNEGLVEYNFTGFDTEDELIEAYLNVTASVQFGADFFDVHDATSTVLAGVVFESSFENDELPSEIKYKLRLPASLRGNYDIIEEQTGLKSSWFAEITYPLVQLLGPRARNKSDGGLPGYKEEGFLYLQNAIDQTLIRHIYNSSSEDLDRIKDTKLMLQRFPYVPYSFDLYLFAMQGFLPLLMLLSFIYPVINITKSIVYEKEKRLKESMKMMGLNNWMHWTAWFIKSYIFLMISCLLITILLKVRFSDAQSIPILPKTDGTLIYFVFLVFSFSMICFCFFISSFFSRANPAATGAGAFWILFYAPFAFLQPRYNLLPFYVKILFCVMTNIPVSFACQIICLFEGNGAGLQWSTINEGSSPDDNFSMAYALLMMVFNGVVHLLITLYIEAVWPGEFGIPLPYNFFLKKWYWTGDSRYGFDYEFEKLSTAKNFNIETSPRNLKAGIQIKGLTKQFGRKTAVNKLNLDIFEGHITALLGHNGAGKTTTISILTGLFPPSSGTAVINGYDIHRDMNAIRSSLGICPQHDVLFDELTVAEHLQFFCLLKGMEKHLVDPEINRLLAALGLESKRHAKSRTLSGGMKRKLSVLIAFCANSKIVLLDECTSGMDSGSRRCTWDLIQSEKKGRTIILSTHFMEEADVLGDRIAIMADGELQCCGSSLFLKKRYGGGYNLIIVKNPDCVVDNITNLLKSSIPEAEMDQNVGAELSYILPDSQSHLFPAVFEDLESRRKDLGIASYGASITTMEEVFMRVLKDAESSKSSISREDLDLVRNTSSHTEINHLDSALLDSSVLFKKEPMQRNSGLIRLCQQFWAMIMKKVVHIYRNRTLMVFQMLLPLIYVIIVFFSMRAFPGFRDPEPLSLSSLERYETVGPTTTLVKCLNGSELCTAYKDHVSENFLVQTVEDQSIAERILSLAEKQLTVVNFKYIVAYEERLNKEDNSSEIIGYFNNQPFHGPPVALNFITNAMLRKTNHTITAYNHPLPFSTLDSVKEAGGILTLGFQMGYNIAIALTFLTSAFVVFLVRERVSGCKHLQFVSGVRFVLFWAANFLVDYITFIISSFALLLILYTFQIEEFMSTEVQFHFMTLMFLFGFSVIPFTYLFSFMATNPTTGYSRLVIFKLFIGLAPMLVMVFITMPGFNLDHLADGINQYLLISPNYAMGQGLVQLSTNFHLRRFCASVQFLEDICQGAKESFCCKSVKEDYLDWERMGIGRNVVYLAVSGILYFTILFLLEFNIFKKIYNCFKKTDAILDDSDSDIQDPVGLEDSDVLAEDDKIRRTELDTLFKSESLVVRDLTKVYNSFVAVDHINFAVQPGECFGLLGVNGAGKTTTFKQLTGDIPASYGDAFVNGKSVRSNLREVHESIGYTPQFDGLIDEMTGRETIRMFARLKGVQEKYIDDLTEELGHVLMFSQHLNKWTCQLSGGNRRKLSTACALVGKPAVVLLDEPSSGMDPVARRHLWNAISMIRDAGTSIVLTTHSLEEAEALCTRMGIMVNGKFRCLGSPQHLKNKFSKGYTLIAQTKIKMLEENETFTRSMEEKGRRRSSVRTRGSVNRKSQLHWESALEDLRTFVEDAFPGCILKDIHPGFVHYHVIPSEETSWGKMFATMEEARMRFDLEAYSVGQTSLEQVFLNFTKSQINA